MWGRIEPNWADQFKPIQTNWGRPEGKGGFSTLTSNRLLEQGSRWRGLLLLPLPQRSPPLPDNKKSNSKVNLFAMIDVIFGTAKPEGVQIRTITILL